MATTTPSILVDDIDIFEALGASDLPDSEKGALLLQMLDLIQGRVFDRIVDGMTEEEQDNMVDSLGEEEDAEKLEEFLMAKVPNYEQLFVEETKKLRHELVIKMAE